MPRSPISQKDLAAKAPEVTQPTATPVPSSAGNVPPPSAEPESKTRDYGEQIAKFIPAEVIAFYLPAIAAAAAFNKSTDSTLPSFGYTLAIWIIFIAGIAGTLAYMYSNAHGDLVKERILNPVLRAAAKASISAFAFFVWALYLGGPFAGIENHQTIGILLILLFTFGSPFLYNALKFPDNAYLLSIHVGNVDKSTRSISGISFKNNCCQDITLGKAVLYWKKNPLVEVPTYELDLENVKVSANKTHSISQAMELSPEKKAKKHVLKIQTSMGTLQSAPINVA